MPCHVHLSVSATVLLDVASLGSDALTSLGCGSGSVAEGTAGCSMSREHVTLQLRLLLPEHCHSTGTSSIHTADVIGEMLVP